MGTALALPFDSQCIYKIIQSSSTSISTSTSSSSGSCLNSSDSWLSSEGDDSTFLVFDFGTFLYRLLRLCWILSIPRINSASLIIRGGVSLMVCS